MKSRIDAMWVFVRDRLFFEGTGLIYDHVLDALDYFPTAEEVCSVYPNPCGYGTGMEDSMINGGSMLLACIGRYQTEGDAEALDMAHRLVRGILDCQATARSHGFLPRSVIPTDGKSHYIDSSRDQYTLCVFGAYRFLASGLATEEERRRIASMLVSFAERAEQNVTPENGFDLLREDGMPTLCTVMWGDGLGNHEFLRLPMIYLAAWYASDDAHWLKLYRTYREEAIERSLPMTGRYWHLYTLQQMQMSVRLCYDLDPDEGMRERYGEILCAVADHIEHLIPQTRRQLHEREDYNAHFRSIHETEMAERGGHVAGGYPNLAPVRAEANSFFVLQDAVDTLNVLNLCPDRVPSEDAIRLYCEATEKIDLALHVTSVPVQILEGYYGG
ncbi:MAG: hypothetical protein IJW16_00470 [Clostridia bacterium]|nr:hypothetical protein [Clostridia bacterium]